MPELKPTLIVITGPTASGKSALALDVARHFGCDIISADSRQLFRDIPVGTAAPSAADLSAVRHHFVGTLGLDEYYSAAMFESDVMNLLPTLWPQSSVQVMCGGSMMYVDAVVNGIDELPTVSDEIRRRAMAIYQDGGIEAIRAELRRLDPDYYGIVDLNNHKRMVHAVEISMEAGVPYSSLRSGVVKQRPFNVLKLAIDMPREELFGRINARVDAMIDNGLEEEARRVYPLRSLNSLNTVGYKEMFAMFDGVMDRPTAIARIGKNTRVYAKKQLTWLKRDANVVWIKPSDNILVIVEDAIKKLNSMQ